MLEREDMELSVTGVGIFSNYMIIGRQTKSRRRDPLEEECKILRAMFNLLLLG